jgi:uncharacterized membrane protein HdeD (DUF308 family)
LSILEKSPKGLRIAQIILGAIAIALSGAVLANPDTTTLFYVTLLGIALIMVGISKIIEGGLAQSTKGSRGISIGIGIISIIGGIFALANPVAAIATLIWIISIFILIHGIGLIASGILTRDSSKGSRIGTMILGAFAVGFASILLASPGLALVMMIMFLSLGLLFNGIASILSGITGNRKISPTTD